MRQFQEFFPGFEQLVQNLLNRWLEGESKDVIEGQIRDFFDQKTMDSFEKLIPGWLAMSSFASQKTMIHTVKTMIALYSLQEYQDIKNKSIQNMLRWGMLLHDIGKLPKHKRDLQHPFKSAAIIAKNASLVGFRTKKKYKQLVDSWADLTFKASIIKENQEVHDFSKLGEIMSGIDAMFRIKSHENYLIKVVLLHQSIDAEKDWPRLVKIGKPEIRRYFDHKLMDMLEIVMLADSKAWNLYDQKLWKQYRSEIKINIQKHRSYLD